jgi:hypothetical protein
MLEVGSWKLECWKPEKTKPRRGDILIEWNMNTIKPRRDDIFIEHQDNVTKPRRGDIFIDLFFGAYSRLELFFTSGTSP